MKNKLHVLPFITMKSLLFSSLMLLLLALANNKSGSVEAQTAPATPQWCVASEQATDAQLQEALDWACSSQGGANCSSIQSDGICFLPNSLTDHASFAFNDYWQKFKASGGSCDFKGSAVLVDSDPSHDPCIYLQLP